MRAYFFILAICIGSCTKSEPSPGEFRDLTIRFFVNDSQNIDLLDPSNTNTLNSENIKIFYINNGIIEEPYNPDLLYPRNFEIINENLSFQMKLFATDRTDVEYPVVLIKWNEIDTDTLKCHYKVTHNNNNTQMYCDSVWYNSRLEFPSQNGYYPQRIFKIVK